MRAKDKAAFLNIVDVIGAADGGVDLCIFKAFLEDFSKKAENGDESAAELLEIMLRFSKLIDVATGK